MVRVKVRVYISVVMSRIISCSLFLFHGNVDVNCRMNVAKVKRIGELYQKVCMIKYMQRFHVCIQRGRDTNSMTVGTGPFTYFVNIFR